MTQTFARGAPAVRSARPRRARAVGPAPVLFLCLFAAQATFFVLPPVVPRMAADLGIPVAAVGQLRAISGLVAAFATFALGLSTWRLGLRDMITAGLGLVAAGSLAAAAAPGFAILATAQVVIGAGLGVVLSAGTAATARWVPAEGRARLLSRALMGPPAAAILGTLAAGALAGVSWRLAWLAVPFAASLVAIAALRTRPDDHDVPPPVDARAVWRLPELKRWLTGELLAYAAWSSVLVFSGALLVWSYGVSPRLAALAISASAAAFLVGNLLTRRWVETRPRTVLLLAALALSAASGAFGAVRSGFWVSTLLLVLLGLLAGGRALAGNAFGLRAAPRHGLSVAAARTTAQQLGYLLGAALGGAALSVGGYTGLAVLVASLFALAALPHARAAADPLRSTGARRRPLPGH